MHLRVGHRQVELLHQVERVVRTQAGGVDVLGEQQRHQHDDPGHHVPRAGTLPARAAAACRRPRRAAIDGCRAYHTLTVLSSRMASKRGGREPGDAALPVRHHDERRQQRPDRRAGAAADLEQRLGEAVAPAARHPRHARRLRMEHRGAGPHQRRGEQDHAVAMRHREQQQAHQAARHRDRQRERLRPPVGHHPDDRLQHRGGKLESQRNQPDLAEIQLIGLFQDRIQRRHQRLVHVVEQMAGGQRDQDRKGRIAVRRGGSPRNRHLRRHRLPCRSHRILAHGRPAHVRVICPAIMQRRDGSTYARWFCLPRAMPKSFHRTRHNMPQLVSRFITPKRFFGVRSTPSEWFRAIRFA